MKLIEFADRLARRVEEMRGEHDSDIREDLRRIEADMRREVRRRAFKAGRILLGEAAPPIDCSIRDLSAYGARLKLGDAQDLPESFSLLVVNSRTVIPVAPIWRRGLEAGVKFTGAPRQVPQDGGRNGPAPGLAGEHAMSASAPRPPVLRRLRPPTAPG